MTLAGPVNMELWHTSALKIVAGCFRRSAIVIPSHRSKIVGT